MTDRRVGDSLGASLRRAAAIVGVGWHLVTIWTLMVTDPGEPRAYLVAAHVVAGALGLLLVRGGAVVALPMAAFYGTWWLDFYAAPSIESALFLAACWLGNLTHLGVMLLTRRWYAGVVPIATAVAGGVLLDLRDPMWSVDLTMTNVVGAVAIVGVTATARRYLWGFVDTADDLARDVEARRRRTTLVTRAAREASDHARLLHDTVVNTLGAIANGGAGVDDVAQVRERCRRDLEAVTGMLDGMEPGRRGLAGVGRDRAVRIVRTGLAGPDLARAEAGLSDVEAVALEGAVGELLRNVEKHAGVDTAVLDIRTDPAGALVVSVIDDGAGFDGDVPAGRGLAQSVAARLEEVGATLELVTRPGSGTRVRITCPARGAPPAPATAPAERTRRATVLVERIRWRACWLWAIGLVVVGVVIEVINRPGALTWTYPMLALVAVVSVVAWRSSRGRRAAPTRTLVLLLVAVPVAFEAGMASAGFGTGDVFHYQAWGLTPLLVALLTVGRHRGWFVAGLVLLAATALVTAVVVGVAYGEAVSAVVIVGVAPALGFAFGWLTFHAVISEVLHGAEADRRLALELRLEAAAREAAIGVRERWRAAQLRDAVEVLRGLAEGLLDPGDPEVRRICGLEEAYVRQLIQLSPDAFRMGPPLARALAMAHSRSIDLAVRTGSVDAPDDAVAETLDAVIDDAIRGVPPGGSMTIGLFGGSDGARLTLVAPAPLLGERITRWRIPEDEWTVAHETFAGQDLVQVLWPGQVTPPKGDNSAVNS